MSMPPIDPDTSRSPSLLLTNLYLVLGLLILVFALPRQADAFRSYMIGAGVLFALALLGVLFMRLERIDVRRVARLHWPGWDALLWTLSMAPGLWVIAIGINVITATLFGYVMPVPPTVFPTDLAGALALLLATIVAAPLCEELMFRGYVQPAYERGGPWIGIPVTALIFAMYHLRFQGLFALIPVSLMLGFVTWRTHSLLPAILLHALYNGMAATLMLATTFLPTTWAGGLAMFGLGISLLCLPLVPLGMWMLWRITAPPRTRPTRVWGWRRWLAPIPLLALLLFYIYAAAIEVVVGGFPELLASESLTLEAPAAWTAETTWVYGLYTFQDDPVGTATCTLAPQTEHFALHCAAEREAFSLETFPMNLPIPERWLGLARAADAAMWEHRVLWTSEALLNLTGIEGRRSVAGRAISTTLAAQSADHIVLAIAGARETETLTLPADVLIQDEWPWRLAGLPFDIAYGASRPFLRFDDDGVPHVEDAYVLVRGGEPVQTPAGNFVTWKVTVTYPDARGRDVVRSAWYDAEAPHTLVRYEDGVVRYLLEE